MEISLDKLPIKRLESIEENGFERFPSDVGYDEKRLSLIRRIDFAWAVEKDEMKKKQKIASDETSSKPVQWQGMVENLQLAHQELSVIIDLINTVEANDAVTVAGMTRPKPSPNEVLSDLAVSAATKLQCFRHLGKYFKKSAKALEHQISREARFYGALIRILQNPLAPTNPYEILESAFLNEKPKWGPLFIRMWLQQNWKVKWHRLPASIPSNEGFSIDLFDNSLYDPAVVLRPSSSTVRVDHDPAGMLAIQLPQKSCRSLCFGIMGSDSDMTPNASADQLLKEIKKESQSDDDCVKQTHKVLRGVHRAIFHEQVFDLVNQEACKPSPGVNVTAIQENYLQLSIGQGASIFISLTSSGEDEQTGEDTSTQKLEITALASETSDEMELDVKSDIQIKKSAFPPRTSFEIFLQQIFHEHAFANPKERTMISSKAVPFRQPAKDGSGILGHFCMSLAHRIFSTKVLAVLENLVCRVPYLHLITQSIWHSRASTWTLFMRIPQSLLHVGQTQTTDLNNFKNVVKSQFRTNVVVNDDCITVEGEGAPNVVGLFKGNNEDRCSVNKYECDLADLPVILLQQVASQVVRWLHDEALMVGIKASRDFLSLSFELDQGDRLSLVARVDPEDAEGCISWWLVMEDRFPEESKFQTGGLDGSESDYRKFLGYLSLDVLYSTVMDLINLCNNGTSH